MTSAKYKIWWIPQAPMKTFEVEVADPATGNMLCDVLGKYDAFQYDNNIKGDYCNAGGVVYCHADLTEGEWWDWPDCEDEVAELEAEIAASTAAGAVI